MLFSFLCNFNFDIQGNFKEMCKLLSDYNSNFNDIFSNEIINYTSPKIQNELIEICADNLVNIIVDEVNEVSFFSIMCDEAR